MGLQLAPIQTYQGPELDVAGSLMRGFQTRDFKTKQDLREQVPALLQQYKSGNQGALLQIANADPQLAGTLVQMQQAKEMSGLRGVQTQTAQLELAQARKAAAIEQHQQEINTLSGFQAAIAGVESPEEKRKIQKMYISDAEAAGVKVPDIFKQPWSPEMDQDVDHVLTIGRHMLGQTTKDFVKMGPGETLFDPKTGKDVFTNGQKVTPYTDEAKAAQDLKNGLITQEQYDKATAAAGSGGLTGQDYMDSLKKEDPGFASEVQAVIEGRGGAGLFTSKGAAAQKLIQAATLADPGFDATTYKKRQDTAQDFGPKGTSGKTITAINTVAEHMNTMLEAYEKINNGKYQAMNWVGNKVKEQTGGSVKNGIKSFDAAVNNIAPELAKISTGTSSPTDTSIKEQRESFNHNLDPDAFKAVIETQLDLVRGKAESMKKSYSDAMRNGKAPPGYTKKAIETFKKMGVDLAGEEDDGDNPVEPAATGNDAMPQGMDPRLWEHMTPEERKLFQ